MRKNLMVIRSLYGKLLTKCFDLDYKLIKDIILKYRQDNKDNISPAEDLKLAQNLILLQEIKDSVS